jgi:MFS family permease
VVWFFASLVLNNLLVGKFPLRTLILFASLLGTAGVALAVAPNQLWLYWIIIPMAEIGGALCWINLGSLLSQKSSSQMQGRSLGASGAMWSFGQIIAPLAAGPLAGWNIHYPLIAGSVLIFLAFLYFFFFYKEKSK